MYMSEDSSFDAPAESEQAAKWNELSVAIPQYSNGQDNYGVGGELVQSPNVLNASGTAGGDALVGYDDIRQQSELFTKDIMLTPVAQRLAENGSIISTSNNVQQSKVFSFDENAVKGVLFGGQDVRIPEFTDLSRYDRQDDGVNSAYIVKDNTGQKWVLKTLQDDTAVRDLSPEEQRHLTRAVAASQCRASVGNSTNQQTSQIDSDYQEKTNSNIHKNSELEVFVKQYLEIDKINSGGTNNNNNTSEVNIEIMCSPAQSAKNAPINQLPKISNLYDGFEADSKDDYEQKFPSNATYLLGGSSTVSSRTSSPVVDFNVHPLHIPLAEDIHLLPSMKSNISTGQSSIASVPTLYGTLDEEESLDLQGEVVFHGPPGVVVGHNVEREMVAKLLDHHQQARVPTTLGVVVLDDASQQLTVASLQRYQSNVGSAEDYGPGVFDTKQQQSIAMLDIRLLSLDRHGGNLLVTDDIKNDAANNAGSSHKKGVVPIDHSYILPSITAISCNFSWLSAPAVRQPVPDDLKQYIKDLSVIGDACLQKQCGIAYDSILSNVLSTSILKKLILNNNLTFHDVGSLFVRYDLQSRSPIELFVEQAIDHANSILRQVDTLVPSVAMGIYLQEFFTSIGQQLDFYLQQVVNK